MSTLPAALLAALLAAAGAPVVTESRPVMGTLCTVELVGVAPDRAAAAIVRAERVHARVVPGAQDTQLVVGRRPHVQGDRPPARVVQGGEQLGCRAASDQGHRVATGQQLHRAMLAEQAGSADHEHVHGGQPSARWCPAHAGHGR